MRKERIWQQFDTLPLSAQRQVAELISSLQNRSELAQAGPRSEQLPLREEPFIGAWKDRADMQDSSAWVRRTRGQEWTR